MKVRQGWAFPDVDEFMAAELKSDGTYQASHWQMALGFVSDWSCAIDGGAHVGTWSIPLAGAFERVIAVEPSVDTCEALLANVRSRGLENIDVRPVALWDGYRRCDMVLDGRGLELKNTGARHIGPGETVRCERIDDWQLPTLGFLKLDVEGAEPFALRGATQTIARCRPVILYEDKGFWKRYGDPRDAVAQLLLTLGYQHLRRAGCDEIWGPR